MRYTLRIAISVLCCVTLLPDTGGAQQTDTSSYFPLGVWGIWIGDYTRPPYSQDLNVTQWGAERTNWDSIKLNYLVFWTPYWVEDTVMAYVESRGSKMDIANWYYGAPNHAESQNSLFRWMISNPLSDSATAIASIQYLKNRWVNRQGFYNYTFGQEHLGDPGAEQYLWPKIEFISRKIHEIDPERRSYFVSGGAPPSGFIDATPHLDVLQMDAYFFDELHGQNYIDQQSAFDAYLFHYNSTMNQLRGKNTEWHAIIQAQREYRNTQCPADLRRPNFYELRAQAYLALSRGSRGITSFVYGSFPAGGDKGPFPSEEIPRGIVALGCNVLAYVGLVDVNRIPYDGSVPDPDGINGYTNLANVHNELTVIGPTIRKLRVYDAFPNVSIPSNISCITSITGDKIEIGVFKRIDEGPDSTVYFMLVNRVCNNQDGTVSPPQSIATTFNHLTYPWLHITEIVSGREWVIRNTGTFTDTLDPGSGKLYKLENANILNLAKQSKTTSPNATSSNNQRKVVRESSGKLHRVFESADHIFYQRIPSGSTSPDTTIQISTGATLNSYPCITDRNGYLWITWQRSSITDRWHVLYSYSTNGGNTWSGNIALAFNIQCMSPGPLPVILGGSPSNSFELMVAYRQSDTGVRTRRTTVSPGSTGWSSPITVTGTTGNSMNPSLNYQTNSYAYFRLTWIDGGKIYHSQYYPNTWTNNTFVNSGTWGLVQNEANPSYALTSSNDIHIVWQGKYYGKDIIVANRNLSTVYATFEPSLSSIHYSKPSITGHESGRASAIWQDDLGNIRKAIYDLAAGWYSIGSTIGTGFNPATSIKNPSGGDGRVIWTQGAWSPYSITLDPLVLNKGGFDPVVLNNSGSEYRRKIILRDTLGLASLSLDFGTIGLSTSSGTETIDFVPVNDTMRYTPQEALSLLETEPFVFPSDMVGITVRRMVSTKNIRGIGTQARTHLEIVEAASGNVLHSFGAIDFIETGGTFNLDDSVSFLPTPTPVSVKLRAKVEGLSQANLSRRAIVINRYTESVQIRGQGKVPANLASTLFLDQNYPNPFNPLTTIQFGLPEAAHVKIGVYDILGREVLTLVNGFMNAGVHQVTLDASKLASGVYFYTLQTREGNGIAMKHMQSRKLLLLK